MPKFGKFLLRCFGLLLAGCLVIGATAAVESKGPSILYLTWLHDPTTTMTVQWHSADTDSTSQISYRKVGDENWQMKEGIFAQISKTNRRVHTVELDGLDPGSDYQFRLVGRKGEYYFRTLPTTLTKPVKFVVGGDAYNYYSTFCKMNAKIASCDPDFVVVGGDIAYTNSRKALFKGKAWELKRWCTFLKEWKSKMVTSDGRLIPFLVVIGNHDIKALTMRPKSQHFLFYELFALQEPGKSYRVFDAGDYLSLFLLDTGHSYHIAGSQAEWLTKALSSRESVPYKMAAYHIGAYPSVYPYHGSTPKEIRSEWSPIFEKYHLNVAFEHHNHAYKRTFPLKAEKIDPEGVVYMGDGSWGVSPRKPKQLWYLEVAKQTNAVCLVTLDGGKSCIEAVDIRGNIIDSVVTMPRPPG